jgi:hypothetical protein
MSWGFPWPSQRISISLLCSSSWVASATGRANDASIVPSGSASSVEQMFSFTLSSSPFGNHAATIVNGHLKSISAIFMPLQQIT